MEEREKTENFGNGKENVWKWGRIRTFEHAAKLRMLVMELTDEKAQSARSNKMA